MLRLAVFTCSPSEQVLNRSPCASSHHVVAQLGQRPRQGRLANLQFLLEFFCRCWAIGQVQANVVAVKWHGVNRKMNR